MNICLTFTLGNTLGMYKVMMTEEPRQIKQMMAFMSNMKKVTTKKMKIQKKTEDLLTAAVRMVLEQLYVKP